MLFYQWMITDKMKSLKKQKTQKLTEKCNYWLTIFPISKAAKRNNWKNTCFLLPSLCYTYNVVISYTESGIKMNGKDKCKILKEIRNLLAKANGIDF